MIRTRDADVLIVGGGPAGASTAFQLARRGARVRLLDRARFPRPKACAECLSPEASRILHDMDVLPALERHAAQMRGMIVRSPDGTRAHGDYVAAHGYRGFRDRGLAIRREILDDALVSRARDAGVQVEEGMRVTDVLRSPKGDIRGVSALDSSGVAREVHAGLVIGADGLRSIVARRLGLARRSMWPHRIAVVAHYRDVADVGDYVEMHVQRDGFVGIADVGAGVTTVAAVFPRHRAPELARDAAGFLHRWLIAVPHLSARFGRATRDGPARVTGPFASHARRAWAPGALLVGDAADFFDPFTGEGIYAGLRGGELAADATLDVLGAESSRAAAMAYRAYEGARHQEFGGKWRVERMIGVSVASPRLVNRATRALSGRKLLADLLVGVTGDFVPAGQVLRLGYLAQLFVLPVPPHAGT